MFYRNEKTTAYTVECGFSLYCEYLESLLQEDCYYSKYSWNLLLEFHSKLVYEVQMCIWYTNLSSLFKSLLENILLISLPKMRNPIIFSSVFQIYFHFRMHYLSIFIYFSISLGGLLWHLFLQQIVTEHLTYARHCSTWKGHNE